MPSPSAPSVAPRSVVYRLETDHARRRDLIVEPWEGCPPYGWMSGYRDHATGRIDYFGHVTATAARRIADLLPDSSPLVIERAGHTAQRPDELLHTFVFDDSPLPGDDDICPDGADDCER